MQKSLTKRQHFEVIRAQLENERASFISHWRDLSDYILPRRARFNLTDANKGDKKNKNIIDSTATLAARTLRSGMMSGVTSPARPWFRLTTPDPELAEFGPVRQWLSLAQDRMTTSYLRSNLYNTLPILYGDLGTFGTAPMFIEEDFTGEVLYTQSFPIGSYMIAKDIKGRVNVFFREFRMTVRQLVEQFGQVKNGKPNWDNFSIYIKNLWDQSQYEAWIDVCHIVMPNNDYRSDSELSKHKKYLSYYYETGSSGQHQYLRTEDSDRYLRESGYDYFPVLCPRWETTGEDVYGTSCPGMDALGDIKQLQHGEKRIMEAVDKMIRPPMTGPMSMKNQVASILPGEITYVDAVQGQGFRPAIELNFRVQEMEMKQNQVRSRIQRAYYEDLFLMLANSDRRQITAREIEERHEEKLLALGPVLEQINQDLLDPLTDITFDIHMRQGLIPPPPKELEGMNLKVEYVSIMAQAQKLIGITGVDRFTGFVSQMASVDPTVLDKIKADKVVDVYADMTSVPPSIIRTDDEVTAIRDQRAQAQQAQAAAAQAAQMAQTAQTMSQTPVNKDGDTALNSMLSNLGVG